MTLTDSVINEIKTAAREYDAETQDMARRSMLGARLDALAENLSEGQTRQVARMLMRI